MLFFRSLSTAICLSSLVFLSLTHVVCAQAPAVQVVPANSANPAPPAAGAAQSLSATRPNRPQAQPAQAGQAYGPQRPVTAPQAPAAQMAPAGPVANAQQFPDPFKLGEAEKQRLAKVLGFWEQRSAQVKTYSCKFKRWDYNAVFGPKNPQVPAAICEGTIRYASPDKGEFRVDTIANHKLGKDGGPPQFDPQPSQHEEHWICDGASVFELNGKTKQLIEERLPPQMKGNAIADGPLPFMFGAKKEKLMARYWLKELVPPKDSKGQYWIEARPKTREDAANFQRITVILDEKAFLPMAMQIYPPGWNGRKNWTRQAYRFDARKVNDPLQRGQDWLGQFISPQVPRGWKKVVNNFGVPDSSARLANPIRPTSPATAQPR